jgi:hypothetical protein
MAIRIEQKTTATGVASMFSESELAELDAILETTIVGRKAQGLLKAKVGKGKNAAPAPVEHRDSPVAVGLVMMTEGRVCGCCKKGETLVKGIMVVYSYRGATIKKPLSTLTEVDYNRLVKTKSGTRDVEDGVVQEIEKCADCSGTSLRMWEKFGVYA